MIPNLPFLVPALVLFTLLDNFDSVPAGFATLRPRLRLVLFTLLYNFDSVPAGLQHGV